MSDYISREAAIDRLNKNLSACNPGTFSELCYADAIETVKHFPAADVEPVRRGRWVNKKGGFFEFAACSLCGDVAPTAGITPNYCPNCGAKMDLEDENDENFNNET